MAGAAHRAELECIINHIFLPPKLPGRPDTVYWEGDLLEFLHEALDKLRELVAESDRPCLELAAHAIKNFKQVTTPAGHISETELANALRRTDDFIVPLHVKSQNAGIIVRKTGGAVHFECFELSPADHSVITTAGRLRRHFPEASVPIPHETFFKDDFATAIAAMISKMSHQDVPEMQPRVKKAGQSHVETRDTTNPAMVTNLFATMLLPYRDESVSQHPGIWKNTRDEVYYAHGNALPWRRSPTWLLLRVSLQRALARVADSAQSDGLYKRFMIFFMSQLMERALRLEMATDIIYVMNAKLASRIRKLGIGLSEPWVPSVQSLIRQATTRLECRWKTVMNADEQELDLPLILPRSMDQEYRLNLPELDVFIQGILARNRMTPSTVKVPVVQICELDPKKLPSGMAIFTGTGPYKIFNLAAFEHWVSANLRNWLNAHMKDQKSCSMLRDLMKMYYKEAKEAYQNLPEGNSLMLITMLDVWMACDRSAIHIHPMLADYDPGISPNVCQALLLRFRPGMERLSEIEQYLQRRQKDAKYKSILTSFGQTSSFSVRYFESSETLQRRKDQIERKATAQRQAKRKELKALQDDYVNLLEASAKESHEYRDYEDQFGDLRFEHRGDCRKCALQTRAENLKISIHEWPLPTCQLEAKSTVFELDVPIAFGCWRDATLFMQRDVLGNKNMSGANDIYCDLMSYADLPTSSYGHNQQRIVLASTTKPHVKTHRNTKLISSISSEADVCLNNGMKWAYYDDLEEHFLAADDLQGDTVSDMCTFDVGSTLQGFLKRSWESPDGLPPNTVVAKQSGCPRHLSVDEFKGLCALPLGHRILWENVLTQLSMPSIDWRKPETLLFVWQITHQAGPPSDSALRASHEMLDDRFVQQFLTHVDKCLTRLKESWESAGAVGAFVILITRLLSLGAIGLSSWCLSFLEDCRETCLKWLSVLSQGLLNSVDETSRSEFCQRALQVALIGVKTFDVDGGYLRQLIQEPDKAAMYLEFSIAVQSTVHCMESHPAGTERTVLNALLLCQRRLAFRVNVTLVGEVLDKTNTCLDFAVKSVWPAYAPTGKWSIEHRTWLTTNSRSQDKKTSLVVHFNLVTAELLVNGLPLSRMSAEYEKHEIYRMLIGKNPIEVMPSAEPGMVFSANKSLHGHQLHFAMDGNDLLVRAWNDEKPWDLLPSRLFNNKLPTRFEQDYAHWYDVRNEVIEFRPKARPWASSGPMWQLSKIGTNWKLEKGSVTLLNPFKSVASQLLGVFAPLELRSGLHLSFDHHTRCLEIAIPRLRIEFEVSPGSDLIKSRQYRDMCVDKEQGCGSLVGLRNMLFLHKIGDCDTRMVLIPESAPTWTSSYFSSSIKHVTVNIARDARRVQVYRLDHHMGRFVGNGSLQSKLFLAELHALTSNCLPDPLTHHTGTEEALNILRSAGVRSFDRLTEENIATLVRLANLTPTRICYPEHLQVMQVIKWDPTLSFLSQTSLIRREVEQLLRQAQETAFLFPDTVHIPELSASDHHLTARDDTRSSTFRLEGFGAELRGSVHDNTYTRPGGSEEITADRVSRVTQIAACFGTSEYHLPMSLQNSTDDMYSLLTGKGPSFGSMTLQGLQMPALQYDSFWLKKSQDILQQLWLRIHSTLRKNSPSESHRFRLMTWLATMSFSDSCDPTALSVLVGLALIEPTESIAIPDNICHSLGEGIFASKQTISSLVKSKSKGYPGMDKRKEIRQNGETWQQVHHRQAQAFNRKRKELLENVASELYAQWPTFCVSLRNTTPFEPYFHVSQALQLVTIQFKSWCRNRDFYEYLSRICAMLSGKDFSVISLAPCTYRQAKVPYSAREAPGSVRFHDLLDLVTPPSIEDPSNSIHAPVLFKTVSAPTESRMTDLVKRLEEMAESTQEKDYVKQLEGSTASLSEHAFTSELAITPVEAHRLLETYYLSSKAHYESALLALMEALSGSKGISAHMPDSLQIVAETSQWPRICARQILSQLNQEQRHGLTKAWKEAIINLGLSLTQLEASRRLLQLRGKEVDLHKELRSLGPREWSAFDHPDNLLLEIEGNLRIRKVQSDIAKTMEDPPDHKNAVMQLNMGEGKSSVIVPIVAAFLADASRLLRVVVARPQSRQMFEMLVSKLGGLIGRRVYHMPFSRSLKLTQSTASFLRSYYEKCRREGGILLLQPENILSFQLMVIETFSKGDDQLGQSLLSIQRDFEQYSRDIVDESDENFSTKFELVYTMGQQRPIDYAPDRWIIIQLVLQLVARYSRRVKEEMPKSLEMEDVGDGCFPRIRFLDKEVSTAVLSLVVDHLCENGLVPGFPTAHQSAEFRKALRTYVTSPTPPQDLIDSIENGDFWMTAKDSLLLIRGLFSSGLLDFVFGKKRWRVNYGLVRTRNPPTSLAVPYLAKDKPSARSEFSHPDVVICLTSLSYYYGGLEDEELFLALSKLSRSDQADTEYQDWVSSAPRLPDSFRHLQGVNIRDKEQCRRDVFPHLRFSKGAVDYFLSHIVFTKEMKEFPERLSASGWDIGREKAHPTTGFSGTNDSRDVLPLNVEQLDLESQKHTNALVLEYLLRRENSVMLLREAGFEGACKATELLKLTIKLTPEVRVILDVGAQIIELTNEEVARTWLHMMDDRADIQAAIFCDDADHICVLDRNGRVERLQTSPFADQLDVCLVYLDQAHTRGIDLRLPQHYRAAVTLGANVVKDRLVQACMRMRKLGFGQSVVFLVSSEIETKIRQIKSEYDAPIGVDDVLAWSIHETWADTRQSIPIWATQGNTFVKHQALWAEAWKEPSRLEAKEGSEGSLAAQFLEDEAQSLDRRYRPHNQSSFMTNFDASGDPMVARIIQRCSEFEGLNHNTSSLLEEQERELSPEIEQERQRELAAPAEPCKHRIHSEVRHFARTGEMAAVGQGFLCAFSVFRKTTAAAYFNLDQWPKGLLVTRDFADTVMNVRTGSKKGDAMDDYQRNIQWLLSNRSADGKVTHLAVLSPFEANGLRSEVASSKKAVLHIYAPRQNVGFTPVDDLNLYCVPSSAQQVIPRRLAIELNLFAGQLYFNSFKEYTEVCDYLCLAWKPATDGMVVRSDGFIVKDDKQKDGSGDGKGTRFRQSPVQFLKVLFTKIRRNTEGVEKTDLGKVLNGAYLTEEDFEERDSSFYRADE